MCIPLFCCMRGDAALRRCFWSVWFVFALPLAVLEKYLIIAPIRFLHTLVLYEATAFWSAWLYGTFISMTIFYPITRMDPGHMPVYCSLYMSVVTYCAAHVFLGWLLYVRWTSRFPLYDECGACISIRQQRSRGGPSGFTLLQLSTGGYAGFLLGFLALAFPLLAFESNTGGTDPFAVPKWCRPSENLPLSAIVIPLFALILIKAHAELDEAVPLSRKDYEQRLQGKIIIPATVASAADSDDDDTEIDPSSNEHSELQAIADKYQHHTRERLS